MSAIQLIDPAPKDEPTQQRALTVATPDQLIALAVERGADLAYVEKLMELQAKWEENSARKAYNEAFAAFQAEVGPILKRKRVHFTSQKGTTDYKHAELSDVIETASPILTKYGLSHSWTLKQEKDWLWVTCTLKHKSGHVGDSATLGGPPDNTGNKNAVQSIASTKTMLERQTLKAVCGLSEKGDDDDGRGGKVAKEAPDDSLLDEGRGAAMNGTAALNTWWGKLSAKQRTQLQSEFGAMRKAARDADAGAQ